MRRRDFIAGMGAATTWHISARAAERDKLYRVALVSPATPVSEMSKGGGHIYYVPLLNELERLGYIEGKNLLLLRFSGEGNVSQFPVTAQNAIDAGADVIITLGGVVGPLLAATKTVPIVAILTDPIAQGLVQSLARPGGNITGVSSDAGIAIWGKRVEMLRETVPQAIRFGVLASEIFWGIAGGAAIREAARQTSVSLVGARLKGDIQEPEYRRVFESIKQEGAQGLLVADHPENFRNRKLIAELTERASLPAVYADRAYVEVGGLMSYGIDLVDVARRIAGYTDTILKGTKPGDIPVYQPTKFNTAINLRTARTLGLTLSPGLLAQADEVVE
jgi:putative tryptophan/tyrosine transport system substrate-binding protein